MATLSPFSLLEGLVRDFAARAPLPPWLIEEGQRRIVLLLNHVLQQEPAAMERLVRQKGSRVAVQWQIFSMGLVITPAGLLDLATGNGAPDLTLAVTSESAAAIAQALLRGDKPPVRIVGDVQLAAEVNWLVDHVRWDIEEDLARIVGDAPAHLVGTLARQVVQALRAFVVPVAATAPPVP